MRLPEHVRRRRLRLILFVSSSLFSLLLACWLFTSSKPDQIDLVGVVSMFAGLGSLVAALAQFLPAPPPPPDAAEAADQLAVTVWEQWSEEVEARQLRDPAVIPLSWAGTGRPVSVPPESVVGPRVGRVRRLSLDGRLEGSFDHAASQLAVGFRQVPSGRLVVLGEPGAGKTVLAIMLTLGLLADRTPGAPVPVLLSVSGWDPVLESLDDFIVGSLATSYYGGHPQIPRHLLERRKLLPVLDGLDEMPEPARRNAVRGLNEACGDGRGVVVTCRSVEYQDVIEGGSPLLRMAPVVEVAPVSVPDIIAYLTDVNWPQGVDWEPVYTDLRQRPDSPAATALSTPLALSLARGVYRNCDRDPRELLGFESRHAIEDHLVDHTIRAAYAPPPGTLPQQADSTWEENAQKAEKYLTFLATYLHQHRERDLAWWLMSPRLFSRWSGLLIGIATGLAVMLLTPLGGKGVNAHWSVLEYVVVGVIAGALTILTWYAAPDQRPGRISVALRGSLHRLRGGFRTGFALISLLAATGLGIASVVIYLDHLDDGGWPPKTQLDFYKAIVYAAGASIALGLAFASHNWLNTSPERSTRTNPSELIRQDRNSTLTAAALPGAVLATIMLALPILDMAAEYVAFWAFHVTSGLSSTVDTLTLQKLSERYSELRPLIGIPILVGSIFAILMLFPRAWTRFTLLRITLAIKGQLPWSFVHFLDDARNRQLLRQSGGLYQFRHIRLQERLASQSLAQTRTPTPHPRTLRRRSLQIAAIATALVAATLLVDKTESNFHIAIDTGEVTEMAFGPKDTLVTVSSDGIVRQWNTKTGKQLDIETAKESFNIRFPADCCSYFLGERTDGVTLIVANITATARLDVVGVANITNNSLKVMYENPEPATEHYYNLLLQHRYRELVPPTLIADREAQTALRDLGQNEGKEAAFTVHEGEVNERAIERFYTACGFAGNRPHFSSSSARQARVESRMPDNPATVTVTDSRCKEIYAITMNSEIKIIALKLDGTEIALVTTDRGTLLYTIP
ncbi:hypothetical protein [Streptomyces sp. NPDC059142]|uniref:hypothetical protein n=1 Tax=Streptomyces sp. NPDC059142 TaxID=3346739 RepID=UPI003684BE5D